MQIQSASLDVPGGCPNKCKFCVSKLSKSDNMLNNVFKKGDYEHASILEYEFEDRLEYMKDLGINTLVLTGTNSEPHLNKTYLELFDRINKSLSSRFKNIELQTSGVKLTQQKLNFLRKIGVKTISLSCSSLNSDINNEINGTPENLKIDLPHVANLIKRNDLNLRLSLNINKQGFGHYKSFEKLFQDCKELGADQVTFRKLYATDEDAPENEWIKKTAMRQEWWHKLEQYIIRFSRILNRLPFGANKYSIHGISTVIDNNCMNKGDKENLKYIILRRNCKLYSEWDDVASLIF